ncbi:MAG: hypothetical protein ACK50J_29410 [Planctomyces sp.]
MITNLVSLTAFISLAHYYRVPGKLYRRFVGESLIPLLQSTIASVATIMVSENCFRSIRAMMYTP